MAILDTVKTALRLKTTAYDAEEITPLIDACLLDLKIAGVKVLDPTDPLIKRAVVLYAKANFGSDPNADRFQKSYDSLKNSLGTAGDYSCEPTPLV